MAEENDIGGRVGLDTTDFKAGIAEMNRSIRVIESGFKAAAAGMDDWKTSEEGLTAKINSLNQITEIQKQKISNLTQQYDQIVDAQGASSRAAQEMQVRINNETAALNRNLKELTDVTASLENFGRENNQAAEHMNDLADSTDKAGKSLSDIGGNVAKGAAIGIAAIGAAAVATVASIFDFSNESTKAMNDFQAKTGIASDKMGEFKDVASAIYADNFGESLDDIAKSMATINQQTGASGDALKGLTENALALRDTFDFDVNESVRSANMLIQQFGMTGEQAYNLIAQGAQWGLDKNGDLLDSVNEYSVHFKQLGFDADEMFNMFSNGAMGGTFSVDKLGDAVKEFGIRAKDGSNTTSDAFKQLGFDVTSTSQKFAAGGDTAKQAFQEVNKKLLEMQDPLKQNQIGTELWGSMWEDLGVKGIAALTNTEGEINNSTNALKDLNNVKYNDVGSALEGLKRKLITSISGPIESEITPRINDLIGTVGNLDLSPIINGFGWVMDNANNIATATISIGAGMVTWNVASMIDGVVKSIKAFQLANEGATIAQWALNAAQAANPIGIVIAAVVALVAGIIYLWNTNEGFRNALISAWETIKSSCEAVFGALVTFFTVTIPDAFNSFIDTVSKIPGQVGDFFSQLPIVIGEFLTQAIDTVLQWGTDLITWVETTIPEVIESVGTFFNELPGKIGYVLGLAIGSVIKWGEDVISWIATEVPKMIMNIINFYLELPGKIATVFMDVINKIGEWGSNVITWIATTVPLMISNIIDFYAELPGKIATVFWNVFSKIKEWGTNVITWASTEIPKLISNIVTFFEDLPKQMVDIGKNIVTGIWEGIKGMAGWLNEKAVDFAGGIVRGIKESLGIHSPSRVMRDEVGAMIGAGMAVGIEDSTKQVNSAMANLNKQVVSDSNVNISTTTFSVGSNNQSGSFQNSTNSTGISEGEIIIPIYLDGDIIAKATAKKSDIIQGKNLVFEGRMAGL